MLISIIIFSCFVLFAKAAENAQSNEISSSFTQQIRMASQANVVNQTVTVTVKNYYPDWGKVAGSLERERICQVILENVPSRETILLPKTVLAKLSSIDKQIVSSLPILRKSILEMAYKIRFEVNMLSEISMTIMDIQRIMRKASALLSRCPYDMDLAGAPHVTSELLGYYMKAILLPILLTRILPLQQVISDQVKILASLFPMIYDLGQHDPLKTFPQFWNDRLPKSIAALVGTQSKLYTDKQRIYLSNFFMERIFSLLQKVLLDFLFLRPFITVDIWTDMVLQHFPLNPMGDTLTFPIYQASIDISASMYFVFRSEQMLTSFLKKVYDNMHHSILLRDEEPNAFVRKVLKKLIQERKISPKIKAAMESSESY